MKINIFLILIVLCITKALYSQCQYDNIDKIIIEHLNILEKGDTTDYENLLNQSILEDVVTVLYSRDTNSIKDTYLTFKNVEAIKKIFKKNFKELSLSLHKKNQDAKLNYISKRILNIEEIGLGKHLSIELLIELDDVPMLTSIYVTKINQCYYLTEPFEPSLNIVQSKQKFEQEFTSNGFIRLVKEIKNTGDTIFDTKTDIKVILVESFANGLGNKEEIFIKDTDSVYNYIPFNTRHRIYFMAEGYTTKIITIDTYGIPEGSEVYKRGYEFNYNMKLFNLDKFKDEKDTRIVANLYYSKETGYFERK